MRKLVIFLFFIFNSALAFAAHINYDRIDRYAQKAPILKNNENLDKLVQYLVQPYQTDEEKARVLLAWIVYFIDYDSYVAKQITEHKKQARKNYNRKKLDEIPNEDILKIRAGVCADIANLYKKMGTMAGLQVEVILGHISGCTFNSFKDGLCAHAWNAVQIDGQWEYVDPTWAMGTSSVVLADKNSLSQYERALNKRTSSERNLKVRRNRQINNVWFLTDKDKMIRSHFPNDEQWQLQKKKITEAEFLGLDNVFHRNAQRKRDRAEQKQQKRLERLETEKTKQSS